MITVPTEGRARPTRVIDRYNFQVTCPVWASMVGTRSPVARYAVRVEGEDIKVELYSQNPPTRG